MKSDLHIYIVRYILELLIDPGLDLSLQSLEKTWNKILMCSEMNVCRHL